MLPKQCIKDISKYKCEAREEKWSQELRARYIEVKIEELSKLSEEELTSVVYAYSPKVEYQTKSGVRRYRNAKRKEIKERSKEEKLDFMEYELEDDFEDYVDRAVGVYMWD